MFFGIFAGTVSNIELVLTRITPMQAIFRDYTLRTRQVLKVRALVLEPVDPGSILSGEFLESHDFTSPSWKKQG